MSSGLLWPTLRNPSGAQRVRRSFSKYLVLPAAGGEWDGLAWGDEEKGRTQKRWNQRARVMEIEWPHARAFIPTVPGSRVAQVHSCAQSSTRPHENFGEHIGQPSSLQQTGAHCNATLNQQGFPRAQIRALFPLCREKSFERADTTTSVMHINSQTQAVISVVYVELGQRSCLGFSLVFIIYRSAAIVRKWKEISVTRQMGPQPAGIPNSPL